MGPLHFLIGKQRVWVSIFLCFISSGAHQQLSDMFLWRLSQREDPQYRDFSPHRLGEDHPDRACPLLHRQDSRDSRGERWDCVCLCINRDRVVRVYRCTVSSIHELFSSTAACRWRGRTVLEPLWTPWSWRDRGASPSSQLLHTPCGRITTSTSLTHQVLQVVLAVQPFGDKIFKSCVKPMQWPPNGLHRLVILWLSDAHFQTGRNWWPWYRNPITFHSFIV